MTYLVHFATVMNSAAHMFVRCLHDSAPLIGLCIGLIGLSPSGLLTPTELLRMTILICNASLRELVWLLARPVPYRIPQPCAIRSIFCFFTICGSCESTFYASLYLHIYLPLIGILANWYWVAIPSLLQ